jgi:hypothetical protein
MIPQRITLKFAATGTDLTGDIFNNGIINSIILVVPNFTNAITLSQIDIYDEDGDVIYTNSTGWTKNASHLLSGLSIPSAEGFSIKATISGAAGGSGGNLVIKTYTESRR